VRSPEPAQRDLAERGRKVRVRDRPLVLAFAVAGADEVQPECVGDGGRSVGREPDCSDRLAERVGAGIVEAPAEEWSEAGPQCELVPLGGVPDVADGDAVSRPQRGDEIDGELGGPPELVGAEHGGR
jgi:hypothetical protein